MRDRRAAAWKLLTPVERDALIVLTAMCKVCSLAGLNVDVDEVLCDLHTCMLPLLSRQSKGVQISHACNAWTFYPLVLQMAARETGLGAVESYMHKGNDDPACFCTRACP